MSKSTDEHGRLYLPKDVRERFGEEYRVVELPDYVALFPVADDSITTVEEAIGDELHKKSVDELQREARRKDRDGTSHEREEHDVKKEGENSTVYVKSNILFAPVRGSGWLKPDADYDRCYR